MRPIRKLSVSQAVRNALKAATDSLGNVFFKTVKRGSKIREGDPLPAVTFRRKGWQSVEGGSYDTVATVAQYQLNVLIGNQASEGDFEALYEEAIAAAERAMEKLSDSGTVNPKRQFRAFPVGGADDVADEQFPECAASLLYEIHFERTRGEP